MFKLKFVKVINNSTNDYKMEFEGPITVGTFITSLLTQNLKPDKGEHGKIVLCAGSGTYEVNYDKNCLKDSLPGEILGRWIMAGFANGGYGLMNYKLDITSTSKIFGNEDANKLIKEADSRATKKRDTKHIDIIKSLNTGFYRQGRPYTVYLKDHPSAGRMGDHGNGTTLICIEAGGSGVGFVYVTGTCVHKEYQHEYLWLSIKDIENYDIDIFSWKSDDEVITMIDLIKANPDKWHGRSYYEKSESSDEGDSNEG